MPARAQDPDSSPRRNAATTKARILSAAQQAFAEMGYMQAGIRHIASAAGVDSALVSRYFGSKAGLFEAALSQAIPDFADFDELTQPRGHIGSLLTAQFLTEIFDLSAQSMIVLSTSDAEARAISARVLRARAVLPLAEWIGGPDAETRAMRLVMLATGFTLFTRQVPLLTLEDAVASGTSQWISDLLQEIVGT